MFSPTNVWSISKNNSFCNVKKITFFKSTIYIYDGYKNDSGKHQWYITKTQAIRQWYNVVFCCGISKNRTLSQSPVIVLIGNNVARKVGRMQRGIDAMSLYCRPSMLTTTPSRSSVILVFILMITNSHSTAEFEMILNLFVLILSNTFKLLSNYF